MMTAFSRSNVRLKEEQKQTLDFLRLQLFTAAAAAVNVAARARVLLFRARESARDAEERGAQSLRAFSQVIFPPPPSFASKCTVSCQFGQTFQACVQCKSCVPIK